MQQRTRSAERARGPVVLLVEDVDDVRQLLAEVLTTQGFAVVEAANGHEAVVKAQAVHPDAIVMDLALPLLGGADAARILRSSERTHAIPILALTGRPREASGRDEFDGVLSKPCVPEVLVRRLREVLAGWARQQLAK